MKRQPRGIPVGGQFAESARAEADVAPMSPSGEEVSRRGLFPPGAERSAGLRADPNDHLEIVEYADGRRELQGTATFRADKALEGIFDDLDDLRIEHIDPQVAADAAGRMNPAWKARVENYGSRYGDPDRRVTVDIAIPVDSFSDHDLRRAMESDAILRTKMEGSFGLSSSPDLVGDIVRAEADRRRDHIRAAAPDGGRAAKVRAAHAAREEYAAAADAANAAIFEDAVADVVREAPNATWIELVRDNDEGTCALFAREDDGYDAFGGTYDALGKAYDSYDFDPDRFTEGYPTQVVGATLHPLGTDGQPEWAVQEGFDSSTVALWKIDRDAVLHDQNGA